MKIPSLYTYLHDFSNPFVFPFSMRQDEETLKDSYAALFSYNASEWGLLYNRVSAKITVNYSLKKADQLHYICNVSANIPTIHMTTFQSMQKFVCSLSEGSMHFH